MELRLSYFDTAICAILVKKGKYEQGQGNNDEYSAIRSYRKYAKQLITYKTSYLNSFDRSLLALGINSQRRVRVDVRTIEISQ